MASGPRASGTTTTTKVKTRSGKSGGVWKTLQKVMSRFLVTTTILLEFASGFTR